MRHLKKSIGETVSPARAVGIASDLPAVNGDAAFKLSRVYAEGWNAARKLLPSESADNCLDQVETLNPYAHEPERSRWGGGFSKALGS